MTSTLSQAYPLDLLHPPDAAAREQSLRVAAATRGDEAAMLWLMQRYRPPLVRLLHGLTGDLGQGEDLAQEAFVQAFRQLRQLRDASHSYPWLRRLAVRLATKQRPPQVAPLLPEDGARDPRPQVEHRLAVQAVLRELPADLRTVLVLRELEQLDYTEISATLAIPVGTVRSRLFTARERFRERWSALECEQPGGGRP